MCVAVNLCDDEIGGVPLATWAPPDAMKMFRIIAASGPAFLRGPYISSSKKQYTNTSNTAMSMPIRLSKFN